MDLLWDILEAETTSSVSSPTQPATNRWFRYYGQRVFLKGVVDVYDVFGFQVQTLQGADRLASILNALVIMPDFCKGAFADPAWFPPDTEEKKVAAAKFRAQMGNPADTLSVLLRTAVKAKQKWPSVQGWGIVGFCWGGKVRTSPLV